MAYRATLKDVAAAAGVSVTTVSLVLNNRPARVSEEKRKAIADAAKKLNYVPNQSARSLVTKQSQLVALIVPDIENLFFAALAKCVEDECAAQGYSLIVANSDDSRVTEHELLQRLPARGVDGVMLIPARESCAGDAAERLREDVALVSCPVVLIDRLTQCGWCDAVGFDNYLGGRLAARYLLEAILRSRVLRSVVVGLWMPSSRRGSVLIRRYALRGITVSVVAIMLRIRLLMAVRRPCSAAMM